MALLNKSLFARILENEGVLKLSPRFHITQWRDVKSWEFCPFSESLEIVFQQLLLLEPELKMQGDINIFKVRCADSRNLIFEIYLCREYERFHQDLVLCLTNRFAEVGKLRMATEVGTGKPILIIRVPLATIPRVGPKLISLCNIFLGSHLLLSCPSRTCFFYHFCAGCTKEFSLIDTTISECCVCGRRYCVDCDPWFVLRVNKKKEVCAGDFEDSPHKNVHIKLNEKSIRLFYKPWIQLISQSCKMYSDLASEIVRYIFSLS